MANPTFTLFHGIPTLYALPVKQRQRRTATNIMAGFFDPLPALVSDSGRDDSSSSVGSIISAMDIDDQSEAVLATPGKKPGRWAQSSARARKDGAIKRASSGFLGKGKLVKRVTPAEKENALSDSDSSTSLSPIPSSAAQQVGGPPAELFANKPKASGFWRARSSNTPECSSAVQKRKHSSLFDDDTPSPSPPTKKSRLSESVEVSGVLSSSESLTSIDAVPRAAVNGTDPPTLATDKVYEEYTRKLTEVVSPHTRPHSKAHPLWVSCELCPKSFESQRGIEKHFKLKHAHIVAHLENPHAANEDSPAIARALAHARSQANSQSVVKSQSMTDPVPLAKSKSFARSLKKSKSLMNPRAHANSKTLTQRSLVGTQSLTNSSPRKKAPRKNVAIKKGWKGWVEEDLAPSSLILLDRPEVLPERTTRSGRKID